MRRFAALLAALALAFVCAGGFAMPVACAEGGEATLPPLRHILEISFSRRSGGNGRAEHAI